MTDWWIDETPPRDPPEVRYSNFTAYLGDTLSATTISAKQAGKLLGFFGEKMSEATPNITYIGLETQAPELDASLTNSLTKKLYPTSQNPTQNRRKYR